jgi:hypothetical protein
MTNTEQHVATYYPASEGAVIEAINAQHGATIGDNEEGWSPFYWVRLINGDLCLATFPRGETYMRWSEGDQGKSDYMNAAEANALCDITWDYEANQ